jgi:hypothetical protein
MQTSSINRWLCFVVYIIISTSIATAQNDLQLKQIWKKHIRGSAGDELISGIALSPDGNVVVAGRYTTANFGASVDVNFPANLNFLSQTGGYADGFAISYSQAGNVNWASRYNRNNNDAYYDIAVAANNTPYAVGGDNTSFSGFAHANTLLSQINASTGALTSNNSSNGNLVNRFNSVAIDESGNFYGAGLYSGDPDFNFSRGTSVYAGLASSSQDGMIVKHHANRTAIWAKRIGGTGYDEINRIIVKGNHLYVVGTYTGKVDFNPSTLVADTFFLQTPSTNGNGFILKLDTAGNFVNAWSIASATANVLNDILVNSANEIYVAGYYSGTIDANPAAGTSNITSAGLTDALLLKLDASGNLIWSRSFGGTQDDRFNRIVMNSNGDVYGCGYFASPSVNFGSPNQNNLTNAGAPGSADGFLVAYNANGNNIFANKFGGTGNEYVTALAMDSSFNLYVAVNFSSAIETEFAPGYSSITTQGGGNDAVLIKYNTICPYIIKTSTDVFVCAGKSIELNNHVLGNNLNKQWKFLGNNISNGAKYTGVNTDTLSIQSLTLADTGIYSLDITRVGCASVSLQVKVGTLTGNSFHQAIQHYTMDGNVRNKVGTGDATISFPTSNNFGPNRFGTPNKAFRITFSNMSLNIPDVTGARQSYAFWYQPAAGGNALSTLIWNGVNSNNRILAINNNVLGTYVNNVFYSFGITLPNNQWNHVVFVKDSSRCLVYINGIKQFDSLNTFTAGSITITEMFGQTSQSQGALGLYDDVRVYNTAIGLDEITTILKQVEIQNLPKNIASCIGQNAVIPVTLDTNSNLTYQWYKDGVLLNNSTSIIGVTNDSLTIIAGGLGQSGNYYVKVTKDCFDLFSDSVLVTFDHADLNTGLLSSYNFNGNVLDQTGNRNLTGSAIYGGTNRFGNSANTVLNANNFANSLEFTPINNDTISIALWYYVMQSGLRTLVASNNSSASHLIIDANNQVGFRLANGNTVSSGVAVGLNTWCHFVVTKVGTNQKIYLNGELIMDVNNSFLNSINNNALTRIANNSLVDSRSYGYFDDMFIYNKALNPTEVKAIYSRFNITRQPATARACIGSNNNVMLSAAFENTDTTQFNMQWLFNGTPISNGAKYQGVNGDTLFVNGVSSADSGSYSLRITPAQVTCASWQTNPGKIQLDNPSLFRDSLILYQKFNGNTQDYSVRRLPSTAVNTTYTTDRFGATNAAINFDGTSAYVHASNAITNNTPTLTVMAWFKSNQATGGIITSANSLLSAAPTSSHALLYIGNDNKLHGKSWNGNGSAITSTNDVNDNQWHHAALVIEGNNGFQRLYLDGALVGSLNTTTSSLSSTIIIGAAFGGSLWLGTNSGWNLFQGQIDDVRIYNRAVAAEEIARMSQSIGLAENGTQQVGVCGNSLVNLVARPQGTGATLQWYKNGNPLIASSNIVGVNNDTLRIASITPADTGIYQLMVTKDCFSVMGDSIKLSIFNTIVKSQVPSVRNVCLNDSIGIGVQVNGASPTFQWYKGNVALSNNSKYTGVNTSTLSIKNINYADVAQYRLRIADQCNNIDSSTVVNVNITSTPPPSLPLATEIYTLNGNYTPTNNTLNAGTNFGSIPSSNRFGNNNNAMNFIAGNSNYATLPASVGVSSRANYTVSLWFKTTPSSGAQGLFGCSDITPANGTPSSYSPILYINNNGLLAGKIYNGNAIALIGSRVDDGNWHQAILSYNSSGMQRLWLDGVLVDLISTGSIITGTNLIPTIGATYGPTYTGHGAGWAFFNGQIDDVRIYNSYALSDAAIAKRMYTTSEFAPSSNGVVCAGQANVSFTSGIFGTGNTYQWKRNGIALIDTIKYIGINKDTLTIINLNTADTGSYVCEAWNNCSVVTGSTRNLSIGTIPTITVQPIDASSCSGGSVVLNVAASGGGLTYQWRKGANNLVNGGNISGANLASLTISNLAAADTGEYTCFISNSCGNVTTNVARVSLTSGLQIIQQPVNVTACAGANAQLVVVTSDPNATYQWRKNGQNINNSNNDTLFLNNLSAADIANYSVQITSVCGSLVSNTVTLNVQANAVIAVHPQSKQVCSGNNVTLSIVASGINLTYQWRKNGVDISGANSATYTINSYSNNDSGSYTCFIGSACNSLLSNSAVLSNTTPVAISSQTATNLTLCPNEPNPMVNLFVNASGSLLGYQWYKDGVAIAGAEGSTYSFNRLQVTSGIFYCKVFGTCDTINSADINYTLITLPVVNQQPVSQSVCSGQTIILTAKIESNSTIIYRWYKDGTALIGGGDISGVTTDSLVITNATVANNGNYYLEAVVCGSVAQTQTVSVVVNSQNSMLSQSPPAIASCAGQNVLLYVNPSVANSLFQWKKDGVNITSANNDTLLLTNATNGDNGTYTCEVTSACGNLVSSNMVVTVNASPLPTITANGNQLSTQVFDSYQWRLNGTNISGANQQTYTATQAGNYSVEVSQNGCAATSSNYNYTPTGLTEAKSELVRWYPNPAQHHLTIEMEVYQGAIIKVMSIDGKLISSHHASDKVQQISIETLTPGMYILMVETATQTTLFDKFVKQ